VLIFLAERRRAEVDAAGASIAGRIQDARLRRLALENKRTEGVLVVAADVGALFAAAASEIHGGLRGFFDQVGREVGWTPTALATVHERMDRVLAQAFAPIGAVLAFHPSTFHQGAENNG